MKTRIVKATDKPKTYNKWMQYISEAHEKDNTIYYKSRRDMFDGIRCTKEEYLAEEEKNNN